MTTNIHERLSAIGCEVNRACTLLVSPSPGNLDICAQILEDAAAGLAAIPVLEAARAPIEARRLHVSIRHAAALLNHASEFHQSWRQILGVMCAGYQAGGTAAAVELRAQMRLEG